MFAYVYQIPAFGLIRHKLTIGNISVQKGLVTLNVTNVLPGIIDMGLSVRSTHMQAFGDLTRQALLPAMALSASTGGIRVPSGPSHLLFLPVLRANSSAAQSAAAGNFSWYGSPHVKKGLSDGSGFIADPGLVLKLMLTPSNPGPVDTFTGSWSSSNSSYILTFKCPSLGSYIGHLELIHPPAGQGSTFANMSPQMNVGGCQQAA
jgi:hypothetical protein